MSIKELFDYAVKSGGGKLPKARFTPPVTGYIGSAGVNAAAAKDAAGERRIYFEGKVSALYEELMKKKAPQKEMSLDVLEASYEKSVSKKNRKTVKLGFNLSKEEESNVRDTGTGTAINPVILAVLKRLYVQEEESRKRIIELARTSKTRKEFTQALSKEFRIEYNLADETAREVYSEQNRNVTAELLDDYESDFEEEAQKAVRGDEYVCPGNITIEPVFREVKRTEVQLPAGFTLMRQKTCAGGVPEKITGVPARLYKPRYHSNGKNSGKNPEGTHLTSEEKQTVKLLLEEMTDTQKEELLSFSGGDINGITPLLVREYLWRKQNGRSIKNLNEEIRAYEKLGELPQQELKKYLAAQDLSTGAEIVSPDLHTASFTDTAGVRKHGAAGKPATSGKNAGSASLGETPSFEKGAAVKLTAEEKEYYRKNRGLPSEGLSPVVKAYIKSGEWKKDSGSKKMHEELPHSVIRTGSVKTKAFPDAPGTVHSQTTASSETAQASGEQTVNGAHPSVLSGPLKQSLSRLAGQRRGTKQPEHEMTRLERINANYEHDRAVLAKNDPLFAKNQFWDAGHAEGSGELSERDIEKISDSQSNDVIRKIKGMQI